MFLVVFFFLHEPDGYLITMAKTTPMAESARKYLLSLIDVKIDHLIYLDKKRRLWYVKDTNQVFHICKPVKIHRFIVNQDSVAITKSLMAQDLRLHKQKQKQASHLPIGESTIGTVRHSVSWFGAGAVGYRCFTCATKFTGGLALVLDMTIGNAKRLKE